MSKTVVFTAVLALAVFAEPAAVEAQAVAKPPRVGILCPVSCDTSDVIAFRNTLIGLRGGSNVVFEVRSADGNVARLPGLADDLVRLSVDAIFTTWGTAAGLAAKRATATIPVVVGSAGELVAAGLVASLNRPGGNVTGISSLALDLEAKRLEFLKLLSPSISRVAVFWDPANPYSVLAIKQERIAADQLGVKLKEIQLHETRDVDEGFAAILGERLEALSIHAYVPVLASRNRIVELAARNRVVTIYPMRDFVEVGGLFSYGANLVENAKRAAVNLDKILNGAKPADLPVEQPMRFELVINLKTARALGLTVPEALLARADQIIE
ncbi:MAG TPA: ABC transporter substrate-binding protein [Stellaceae bacterium]